MAFSDAGFKVNKDAFFSVLTPSHRVQFPFCKSFCPKKKMWQDIAWSSAPLKNPRPIHRVTLKSSHFTKGDVASRPWLNKEIARWILNAISHLAWQSIKPTFLLPQTMIDLRQDISGRLSVRKENFFIRPDLSFSNDSMEAFWFCLSSEK